MKSVTEVPLLDVAEGIFDGPHATPPESMDGPIFLRLDNITPDGRLDLTDLRYINQSDFPRWTRRVTPLPGDVVFSYEATLHRYVVIPEGFHGCLGRRLALIRPNRKKIEPRYLHYYFLTPRWRAVAGSAVINGATVDRISLTLVRNLPIQLPSLQQQRRIVNILSAYDDLIENNRRRMALLEESARLLYQEWFVRLRFPGHEHVRITNGVPDGWSRRKLIELCESVDYGYTASANQEEIGPKFLRITDIVPDQIDWSSVPYCPIEDERMPRFRLHEGDIVVARTGATVGYAKRLHKRHPEAVFASYLVRLRPRHDVDSLILGIFVESQAYRNYVLSHVGGAAQPNANAQVLAAAKTVMPTKGIQRKFRDLVEPLIDGREILQLQNQSLRFARDLLLPRLMCEEVSL
jgi:type I restriction enzyme S subunit